MKRTVIKQTVREFVWSRIRALKVFTIKDLMKGAPAIHKLDKSKIRYYLQGWESAKFLSKETNTITGSTYTLIKDTGVHPPFLHKDGSSMNAHLAKEQMWRTMRMIGTFNYRQLAKTASTDDVIVSEVVAKQFSQLLAIAGYLRIIKQGSRGGIATYQFKPAAWTGSKPPLVQKHTIVYDQNTHQIVYPKPEEIKGDY